MVSLCMHKQKSFELWLTLSSLAAWQVTVYWYDIPWSFYEID